MDALQHLIEEWACNRTKNEIWRLGQDANVPVFPVHTPGEVVADAQMVDREFFEPLAASVPKNLSGVVPGSPFRHIEQLSPTSSRVAEAAADGPRSNMRAYGQTIHAYAGMAGRVGYRPDDLRGVAGTWADPLTGVFQAAAIMAAVRHQHLTGGGANIDLSMAECAIAGVIPDVFVDHAAGQLGDELPENRSRRHLMSDVFRCRGSESWIAISIRNREEEAALRSILGISSDTDISDRSTVEEVTGRCDSTELASLLQQRGVAAHCVNDAAQALTDPHALRRGMTSFMAGADAPYLVATMPWRRFRGTDEQEWPLRPAPRLGEHTAEVLKEWSGMSSQEIDSLTDQGVLR